MSILLKPGWPTVLIDGTTHTLPEPPTMGAVHLLVAAGWAARFDAHDMSVELIAPTCGCNCTTQAEGAVTIADCRD